MNYYIISFSLFLIYSSIAIFCIMTILREIRNAIEYLKNDIKLIKTYTQPNTYTSYDFVTCGGCGKSVPTVNGFTPYEHNCPAIENNL